MPARRESLRRWTRRRRQRLRIHQRSQTLHTKCSSAPSLSTKGKVQMSMMRRVSLPLVCIAVYAFTLSAPALPAQSLPNITTPKEALGFNIGDDFHMASYTQLEAYWTKLASESDRMKLVVIGPTAEGRKQYMAIISSPENMKNLSHYEEISRR